MLQWMEAGVSAMSALSASGVVRYLRMLAASHNIERGHEFEERATSDPVLARMCRCLACLEQSLGLCRHVTNIRPRRARVSPKDSTDDPARIKAYITATDAYKLLMLYQTQNGLYEEHICVQPDTSCGGEYRQNSSSERPILLEPGGPFQSRRHIPPGRSTSGA